MDYHGKQHHKILLNSSRVSVHVSSLVDTRLLSLGGSLSGCQIKDGEDGICMLLTEEGRPSGEALIEMETIEDYDKGLMYDKKHMGSRYIEVFASQPQDLARAMHNNAFSGNGAHHNGSDSGDGEGYVRLRGLPYGCRRQQIEEFFEGLCLMSQCFYLLLRLIKGLNIPQDGVVLPTDHLGRSSGEAYVKFISREQADKAMGKHKEKIGHRWEIVFRIDLLGITLLFDFTRQTSNLPFAICRYIEIFKSSPHEFRSISFNASRMFQKSQEPPDPWFPPYRPVEGPRMRYNPRVAPYDRFVDAPRGPYSMPRNVPLFRRSPQFDDYYFRGTYINA